MKWKLILSLLVTIACLPACSSRSADLRPSIIESPTLEVTKAIPSPNPPVATRTASPQPITPSTHTVPVWKVSPKPTNYNFGWMAGKNTLLYTNRDSADGWSYDVVTQKNEPYRKSFPWQPDAKVLAKLPANAQAVAVSPNGIKMLYTIPNAGTISTDHVDGPTAYKQQFAELWLFDGEKASQIGEIEDCIGRYLWSANEQVVIVLPDSPPRKCETAESWILNLKTGYLTPWLTRSDHDRSIHITDINYDGSAVLFGTPEGSLYIRDLSDDTDTLVLSRPGSGVKGEWLHDGQKLLIGVTSLGSLTTQMLIYSNATTEPQEVEIAPLDLFVSDWHLSSDREWLAFLTEKRDEFQSNGLWIADLRSVQ